MRPPAKMIAPGPFRAEHIRSGDPYELSNGHAIFTPPTGRRGGRANLVGGEVLDTDPNVDSAGVDVGVSRGPRELRAPDVSVGGIADEPGWSTAAPPLAVEYADVGQNEDELTLKIDELLTAGTRYIWVVRLAGERCVEVHEPGKPVRIALPNDELTAPGVLANPVPVLALYDRETAHAVTLRNLLNRRGFRDLADVQQRGREEGREEGRVGALRKGVNDVLAARGFAVTPTEQGRIEQQNDADVLARWLVAAATAPAVEAIFDD